MYWGKALRVPLFQEKKKKRKKLVWHTAVRRTALWPKENLKLCMHTEIDTSTCPTERVSGRGWSIRNQMFFLKDIRDQNVTRIQATLGCHSFPKKRICQSSACLFVDLRIRSLTVPPFSCVFSGISKYETTAASHRIWKAHLAHHQEEAQKY